MNSTGVLTGNDQRINFFNLFISSKKTAIKPHGVELSSPKVEVENPLRNWFERSSLLIPVEFKTITAGEIFQTDRVIVKFRLGSAYRDHFVLFRGLLEFSRPKEIYISSNNAEKAFELHVGKNQAIAMTIYLDKILDLLVKEISFKKSLKGVIRFEQAVRLEQSKLYNELRASVK